jgi:hypothetical protein
MRLVRSTRVPIAAVIFFPMIRSPCAAGLHPLYVSAPALRHVDVGYNGYAVMSANPAPGSSVQAGSVVDMVLVTDVNAGAIPRSRPAVVPSVIGLDVNKGRQ